MPFQPKTLNLNEASRALDVSEATLRNWVKLGLVQAEETKPLRFELLVLEEVKDAIRTGRLQKLAGRANKKSGISDGSTVKHLADQRTKVLIERFVQAHQANEMEVAQSIQSAFLIICAKNNLLNFAKTSKPLNLSQDIVWASEFLETTFSEFLNIGQVELNIPDIYWEILEQSDFDDVLGIIYQGIIRVGDRSKLGSFYTPKTVVQSTLGLLGFTGGNFLDPTCGTGQFIIEAIRLFGLTPNQVYGFDLDPIAITIAKFNVLREFEFKDIPLQIFQTDTIFELASETIDSKTDYFLGFFDCIATNPPWGNIGIAKRKLPTHYSIQSGEMFSLIIEKCFKLLKKNGKFSFVLPESVLNIAVHNDVRKLILQNSRLGSIVELGKPFPTVMSNVIILSGQCTYKKNNLVKFNSEDASFSIEQDEYLKNKDFIIEMKTSPFDKEIIDFIYSRNIKFLDDASEWSLGIVTGDNKRTIHKTPLEGMEVVLKGTDIKNFIYDKPTNYFRYLPEQFQQVASNDLSKRPEKLIYRFISKYLVFAIDRHGIRTLNSANLLVPNLGGFSNVVVSAFLNSDVLQYIHDKRFSTHKILKNNLKQLPFPQISQKLHEEIENLVELMIEDKQMRSDALDELIYQAYSLPIEYIQHIQKETNH